MTAFYERDGDAFVPSELTRGPWDAAAQHAGPPSALLGRAVERDGWLVGRITIEILRPVPLLPLTVQEELVRPGRNTELAGAVLSAAGSDPHPIARALAWRLKIDDGIAALPDEPPPAGPETGTEGPFFPTGQDVGYHTAMDYRFLAGGFTEPGPASVWLCMRQPLIEGEPVSPLTRVLAAADSGNGVSATLDWREHLFINTELSVHLVREPAGEWVHLDAVTRVGPHGIGLSETVLSDEQGRLGRASQTLFVRRR